MGHFFTSCFYLQLALVGLIFPWVCSGAAIPAAEFQTSATHALLVDMETDAVLFEKNASESMVPSSMTKILTAYVLFDLVKKGHLGLSDTFRVSERAWRMGGSKMFVPLGKMVSLEDLIQGIIVQSGNDACIVAAEGVAGSEEAFVDRMNAKARELGATHTRFLNATGWPDPGHTTTCWDLLNIAKRTILDFPDFYRRFYSQRVFTYHNIKQYNRNPLLIQGIGDGLKTGHTVKGGHGVVGSAQRQGRRLLVVVNGFATEKQRGQEVARLVNWGFQQFETYFLFKAGEPVEKAEVWMGSEPVVPLIAPEAISVTVRRRLWPEVRVKVRYNGPVTPPIQKGQPLGELVVSIPEEKEKTFPLVAACDVKKQGVFKGIWDTFYYLIWGAKADVR